MTNENTKLYTVLNKHGVVQEAGCTIEEAARAVLQYDGHEYDIRPETDGEGFRLWTSQFSRNSPAYKGLTKSVIFSLADTFEASESEIFQEVIKKANWWCGCYVMSDADFGAMMVEASE